jgi:entericidin B
MKWLRRIALWSLLAVLSVSVLGCHTVRGAGEDIEHGGEAIQDAAR